MGPGDQQRVGAAAGLLSPAPHGGGRCRTLCTEPSARSLPEPSGDCGRKGSRDLQRTKITHPRKKGRGRDETEARQLRTGR